jgi:hypothetical protein
MGIGPRLCRTSEKADKAKFAELGFSEVRPESRYEGPLFSPSAPARPSPLAELLQGSPQIVDVVADLLHFGPELPLQALALGTAEPSGAAPLLLQPEALVLQLRDSVADLSTPAHVLSLR